MKRVLFLCTGNSCRSQMAEGWARRLWGDRIEVHSAGTQPSRVHPDAIAVMAEAGVDLSGHRSKHVEEVMHLPFDLVVTVCDNAKEQCPVFPGKVRRMHRSFKDPTNAVGTREEVLAEFRNVRDEIRAFVETLPRELLNSRKDSE
jgi:arsenate reductase